MINFFDIFIISVVLISTLIAFLRGFIKTIFSLLTWGGAIVITFFAYPSTYANISDKISNKSIAAVTTFVILFIVSFIILAIIDSKVVHVLRKKSKGFVDRSFGLGFGLLRGVLIASIVFFSIKLSFVVLGQFDIEKDEGPEWFVGSSTYVPLNLATNLIISTLPDNASSYVDDTIKGLKDFAQTGDIEVNIDEEDGEDAVLNEQEREIMKDVIASLPQEELEKLYKKFDGSLGKLSAMERASVYREIFAKYKQTALTGDVDNNKISDANIKILEEALKDRFNNTEGNTGDINNEEETINEDEGANQDQRMRDGLDRLIQGVDKESTIKEIKNDGTSGYKTGNIKQMDRLINTVQ